MSMTVSFKGRSNYTDSTHTNNKIYTKPRIQTGSQLEKSPQFDKLERTTQRPRNIKHRKRRTPLSTMIKSFAGGVAATILVNTAAGVINQTPDKVTIPYNPSVSITEIAERYDTDINAILDINQIDETTDLNEITELIIPTDYDYLDTKIETLQNKLFSQDLSDTERAEIEQQIEQLIAKQEYQQNIATVYTDGEYIYFELKTFDENTPDDIKDRFKYGINVETFKDIFDIKDKALRKHNNISYIWTTDDPEYGGYLDFTVATLYPGRTVKVPLNAIKTNDINFDY